MHLAVIRGESHSRNVCTVKSIEQTGVKGGKGEGERRGGLRMKRETTSKRRVR